MTIQEIYKKYNIMPSLQKHQFRVAGVAHIICTAIQDIEVDTDNIVMACLLHDMGNIIKFDLDIFPRFVKPEGKEYWQRVQDEYIQKYGTDEHVATMEIARDVLKSDLKCKNNESQYRILELIDAIGFSNAGTNAKSDDFGRKIAAYADMRVEPYGVVSLEKRLVDGSKRFNRNKPGLSTPAFVATMAPYLHAIETQIFKQLPLKPTDITDTEVENVIPQMLKEVAVLIR